MPKRNLIWIGGIILAALVAVWATRNTAPLPGSDPELTRFRPVIDSYRLIRENYLHPVAEDELKRGAVSGMVNSLDEFCSYVPPGKVEAFDDRMMGTQSGLGIKVEAAWGGMRVLGCLLDSPAHRGGILAGDILVSIDGKELAGLPLPQVEKLLQGKVGSSAKLSFLREGRPRTLTLSRTEFPVESVQGIYRREDGSWCFWLDADRRIAYLRVREFVKNTGEQMQQAIRRLDSPASIVLDLRDNPGGLLTSAVEVSNLFLREGPIVTVVGRDGLPQRYAALSHSSLPPVPVVVLVDSRTASAAEIVAGALKHNSRAVLVGTRTRGKGCVQSLFRLEGNLGQINLTTSEYFIGVDERISRRPGSDVWGVDPDEQVILMPSIVEPLARMRLEGELLGRPPADALADLKETAALRLKKLCALDKQLTRASELLRSPREMEVLLKQATALRAKKSAAPKAASTGPGEVQ